MKLNLASIVLGLVLSACIAKKTSTVATSSPEAKVCSQQIGVPTVDLELRSAPETLGRQNQSQWCWAASSQMILNYHHIYLGQESLVMRSFGEMLNQSANVKQIESYLNGMKVDPFGKPGYISASRSVWVETPKIVDALRKHNPMLVGLRNRPEDGGAHALVLTALNYHIDPKTQDLVPEFVTIRDPWPTEPSKQVISWEEFNERFVGVVYVEVKF